MQIKVEEALVAPLTRNTQTVIGHTNLCNKYGGPWTLAILALPDNLTFDLTHLIRMHIKGNIVTVTDIRTNSYNMPTTLL